MRKAFLSAIMLTLLCTAFTVPAFADYGYTETSQIPMARDFTVEVVFDAKGNPKVLTDYPYKETGAKEMNLVYNLSDDEPEAVSLVYRFATGETFIHGYAMPGTYDFSDFSKAAQAIRSGEVTLDDRIFINTSRNSTETDWLLQYSLRQHDYISYEERTHSQGFNGMGAGGFSSTVFYEFGEMTGTTVMKRIDDGDLVIHRNRTGQIEYAYVVQYGQTQEIYNYDSATGLFDGHRLSELGYEDSDIEIRPLAMIGAETDAEILSEEENEVITVVSQANSYPVTVTRGNAATTIVGGLLSGILIGLTLFRMIQRRKEEKKPAPAEETAVPEEIPESQARNMNG